MWPFQAAKRSAVLPSCSTEGSKKCIVEMKLRMYGVRETKERCKRAQRIERCEKKEETTIIKLRKMDDKMWRR